MTAPNRTYTQVGDNGYAQVDELYVTGNVRGPGAPTTFVEGNPDGAVSGSMGQLAIDRGTGDVYQNTDDAMAWSLFASGGGGAAVLTETPIVGDGAGTPVTYKLIGAATILGNNTEVPAKPIELTPAQVASMLGTLVQGTLLAVTRFTANGAWTPNTLARRVRVTMVGGGGGSGGVAQAAADLTASGGGCSGAYWEKVFTSAVAFTGGAVAIGAAGAAGAAGANNGGNGGNTTVVVNGTTYTASGGGGGQGANGAAGIGLADGGQAVAASSAGDVVYQQPGGSVLTRQVAAATVIGMGGWGGSTALGSGGRPGTVYNGGNSNPVAATGFGAGGGGICSTNGGGTAAGRAGTAGYVVIEEWA